MTNANKVLMKCLGKNKINMEFLNDKDISMVKNGKVSCSRCGTKLKYKNNQIICPNEDNNEDNHRLSRLNYETEGS